MYTKCSELYAQSCVNASYVHAKMHLERSQIYFKQIDRIKNVRRTSITEIDWIYSSQLQTTFPVTCFANVLDTLTHVST